MAQDAPETGQLKSSESSSPNSQTPPAQFASLLGTLRHALNRPAIIAVLLVASTMLLLKDCWNSPFYKSDDDAYIYHCIEGAGNDLPEFVQHEMNLFRSQYVMVLSFKLDYALFGKPRNGSEIPIPLEDRIRIVATRKYPQPNDAWAYAPRLMNGLYHTIAGFLLWCFLRRLGAGTFASAFAAVLWTGHPMACESVCWIAERKNVLMAMFGFGSLLAWTADESKWWRWPLVSLFFLCALMSKASALGLLPVYAALEIIDPIHRRFSITKFDSWLQLAMRLAVPAVFAVAFTAIGMSGFKNEMVKPPGGSVFTAILTDVEICWRYIQHIHFPANLSFFYSVVPIVSLSDARLWIYGIILLAYAGLILWLAGNHFRLALLGLVWFVAVLGPHWNLIALVYPMQDRYAYLGTAGLLLAFATALRGAYSKLSARSQQAGTLIAGFATVCLIANGFFLIGRAKDFESDEILMLDAVKKQPLSGMARYCASEIYQEYYQKHASFGPKPDPKLEQIFLAAALEHYQSAQLCPDVDNFFEKFYLKVMIAELLMRQNRYVESRKTLDGWLPPKNMRVAERGKMPARGETDVYMPQTLAHAWLVIAEVAIRESFIKELSAEARMDKCKEAISVADKAIEADTFDFKPHVVKARSLFRLAEIEHQNNQTDAAKEHLEAARKLLYGVPVNSERADVAKLLLKKMVLPEKR